MPLTFEFCRARLCPNITIYEEFSSPPKRYCTCGPTGPDIDTLDACPETRQPATLEEIDRARGFELIHLGENRGKKRSGKHAPADPDLISKEGVLNLLDHFRGYYKAERDENQREFRPYEASEGARLAIDKMYKKIESGNYYGDDL